MKPDQEEIKKTEGEQKEKFAEQLVAQSTPQAAEQPAKEVTEEFAEQPEEQSADYINFVKDSVADGSYYKDALNWYFFRYVAPICDRTLLIFGAIIAAVVLFFLIQMVKSAFPLVETTPIIIRSKDQSLYFPQIVELKPKKNEIGYDRNITNVDDAVLKYLLSHYITTRESYDFSKGEIEDVNNKFNQVKNTTGAEEFRNFQLIMSKDNPNSPINDFGQNITKTVTIESVKITKEEGKDLAQKARLFLSRKLPTDAEINFSITKKTRNPDNTVTEEKEPFLAKVNFVFGGVNRDGGDSQVKFIVNKYTLYKVK